MKSDQRPTKSRIPEFKSYEEEAEFWDTHDATDFVDESRPVKMRFARELSHSIIIDLDPQEARKLWEIAGNKAVNPVTLAKTWILDHLNSRDESNAS